MFTDYWNELNGNCIVGACHNECKNLIIDHDMTKLLNAFKSKKCSDVCSAFACPSFGYVNGLFFYLTTNNFDWKV